MKFQRRCLLLASLLVAGSGLISGTESRASILSVGDVIKVDYTTDDAIGYGGQLTGGGEFLLYKKVGNDWQYLAKTFCMERLAEVNIGEEMIIGGISDRAISPTAPNNPDLLDARSDFLYRPYLDGSLSNFDLGGGVKFAYEDDAWADALQEAFWKIEGEFSLGGVEPEKTDLLVNYATGQNPTLRGDVFVLNLFAKASTDLSALAQFDPYDASTYTLDGLDHRQDLLWYSTPNHPIPEPATFALWGTLGMIGFAATRWSRRRKSSR